MTIADRIKNRRIQLDMTQDELAHKMGYSTKSAVSRTENSGDEIGINRLAKFAEALGVTSAYLLGWEELDDSNYVPDFIIKDGEDDMKHLIDNYNQLNPMQQELIKNMIEQMLPNKK